MLFTNLLIIFNTYCKLKLYHNYYIYWNGIKLLLSILLISSFFLFSNTQNILVSTVQFYILTFHLTYLTYLNIK